jgi:hypothetical protein
VFWSRRDHLDPKLFPPEEPDPKTIIMFSGSGFGFRSNIIVKIIICPSTSYLCTLI